MQYFVYDLLFFGNSKLQEIIVHTDKLDLTCLSTVFNHFKTVTYIDYLKFCFCSSSKN